MPTQYQKRLQQLKPMTLTVTVNDKQKA